MSEIPYTVKPHWIHKGLFIVLCFSIILPFYFFESGEFWNSPNDILRNILVVFYLMFVLMTVGLFIRNLHDLANTKGNENLVQRHQLC
jgi:uncharacterized membrane protein YhaH (DUF805 family)